MTGAALRWAVVGVLYVATAGTANGQSAVPAAGRLQPIQAPGFRAPVPGRWLTADEDRSGVSLGGLGTGFMELRPDARFHDTLFRVLERPAVAPPLRLSASFGSAEAVTLLASANLPDPAPAAARYFGHFPMVDLDYGRLEGAPVRVWCRAFTPFVPRDAALSNTPGILLSVRLTNESDSPLPAALRLTWLVHASPDPASPLTGGDGAPVGLLMRNDALSYAVVVRAGEWKTKLLGSTGAEVAGVLPPRGEKSVILALAWHVPSEAGQDGRKRAPRYSSRFADAGAAAQSLSAGAAGIEARIIAWQEAVYTSEKPDWLKDALINSLYMLPRNTHWFADGFQLAEQDGRVVESIGSRLEGGFAIREFFPQLEEESLRRLAAAQDGSGEIPGRLGGDAGPSSPRFGPGRVQASLEYALLCRRMRVADPSNEQLPLPKWLYASLKRALQFALTLDRDADGLVDEPAAPQGLAYLDRYRRDWVWHGTSAYTAFLTLAALRAGEEAAKETGDEAFADWCRDRFESGRRSLEENLWRGTYYRLFTDPDGFRQSDASFAGSHAGQVLAWKLGLGDLCERSRAVTTLQTLIRQRTAGGNAEAVTGLTETGKPDESGAPYSSSVVPRDIWLLSAGGHVAGGEDAALRASARDLGERVYRMMVESGTLWSQPGSYRASADGGPGPSGDRHYLGNLAVWLLAAPMSWR